ncbi:MULTISPECIES: TonB-dependent siderophore receptor [Pseudomonas]|uniref:TonB-dependent receptor n=1 Tax=Pseudomonas TaxID=286 RepID=UPI000876D19A|nr:MULTISPECIES: TonB-dependent siderophore receptor [Pseudomonas]PNV98659.1 TonB-dependent siderophore receptor [Pseudomonas protegens]UVM11926.1 TonB-dependent siderophore receptor [Pseudomonas protegens]SCZ65872.1 catecholate siderophore receptor [Pseudomonas sp. NFPP17]SDA67260.1 catecholate siderophore receptor [Pseudomonas sp. NFPP15]SEL00915.1 catecholate siderophore receptor [Pseudomonas sp. NFPP18]
MSRQQPPSAVSSPRLLASAIGVAITAGSAGHMVQAAQDTNQKTSGKAIALDATSITGEAQDNTSYQVEKASSQKYTAPLVDTPRSVTVVPQQVLKDTAATSLQDALRTVPGITFGAGEGGNPQGDRPFIRGFDAQGDTYLDGVRDTGGQSREIFDIETIEVSKGPNSAFGGRGSAGGSLNLTSKMPKQQDFLNGGFTYGSDQTRRYTLDVNRQFLEGAAFRLNLMSHEQNVAGRDAVNYDRWGVAPSLTFGLGTPTRVNLSYYHMESDDLPDSGIPYGYSSASATAHGHDKPTDGGDSNNFYGLKDRDFRKTRADISTFSIEHDLSDTMTLKNTLRHGSTGQDYVLTQPDDSKFNVNRYGTVWRRANSRVSTTETTTNQTDLFGEFHALGFKHNYSTGLEFTGEETRVSSYTVSPNSNPTCTANKVGNSGGSCTSLGNPNPDDAWTGSVARNYNGTNTKATSRAAYVFDTIELDPQWLLNVGLRYDTFDTVANTNAVPTATVKARSKLKDDSQFWNWQAGLVWKPTDNGSVYASYATSATPAGALVGEGAEGNPLAAGASTSDLQPEETVNYELGTKWNVLNDRLSLTAAVFRTEKKNTRVLVDALTYQNAGESRVDGLELGASGKITDKWQVFAGYSYLKSELVDPGLTGRNGVITAGAASAKGNEMPNTPKNSFSLWSTYAITSKLTVGGGAFYVDDVYGDTGNTVYVPSYTRYDAMASYKLTKNVDLQLNVQNLTDKTYYDKAYASHFANQAAGRTALMSANFHF